MSLPSSAGRRYRYLSAPPLANDQGVTGQEIDTPPPPLRYPYDDLPIEAPSDDLPIRAAPPRSRYDNAEPFDIERTVDPVFQQQPNRNPNGADIGPEYMTPRGRQWIADNIWSQGWSADIGAGTIIDAEGTIIGELPEFIPQMM